MGIPAATTVDMAATTVGIEATTVGIVAITVGIEATTEAMGIMAAGILTGGGALWYRLTTGVAIPITEDTTHLIVQDIILALRTRMTVLASTIIISLKDSIVSHAGLLTRRTP